MVVRFAAPTGAVLTEPLKPVAPDCADHETLPPLRVSTGETLLAGFGVVIDTSLADH